MKAKKISCKTNKAESFIINTEHVDSVRHLLSAREQLMYRTMPNLQLTMEIDFAFLKSGILISSACLAGAFRFDDVVDWVRKNAGFALLNLWKYYPKGNYKHNDKKEKAQHRAFNVGGAFVYGLPDCIVNKHTNPYIGDEQAMGEILNGKPTIKTLERCERSFEQNGCLNPNTWPPKSK